MWDLLILNPMINALLWIYGLLGNFGFAIIVFTILVRMLTYPLTIQQLKGTQKLQDLQNSKEWLDLAKKYKDKQELQMAQAKLMQDKGVNMFGSCLPTLIQFPIIIGLYQAIMQSLASTPMQMAVLSNRVYSAIDVSRLLPINNLFLWMDLGQPEKLMIFGIPIPLLAIVVVITTYLQGKLMMPPAQPGADPSAQMTQQTMNLTMPIMMGYMALTFASGLSLYFVASNLVSVVQYAAMGKLNWNNLLPGRNTPATK